MKGMLEELWHLLTCYFCFCGAKKVKLPNISLRRSLFENVMFRIEATQQIKSWRANALTVTRRLCSKAPTPRVKGHDVLKGHDIGRRLYTGVLQWLCFGSGVAVVHASGRVHIHVMTYFSYAPRWFYMQNDCCRCVFHVWVKLNVSSCETKPGRRRQTEKRGVREWATERESDGAEHGSPQMLLFRIPGSWSHAVLSLFISRTL